MLTWFALDRLVEQQPETLRFLVNALPQGGKFAFESPEAIREVKAGKDGDAHGVGIGGPRGDGVHQLVHAVRQFLDLPAVAGRAQGVRLVKNRDLDSLLIFDRGHGLAVQRIDLAEQLLDAPAHLLAFRAQRLDFVGQVGCLLLETGGLTLRGIALGERSLFLAPQPGDEIDCLLNALFERDQRIGFLFEQFHR